MRRSDLRTRAPWGLGVALGLALSLGAASAHAAGIVLRDDLKRDVAVPRDPQRIVSLLPSLTETVCALGACDRLVATDEFSNWPAAVRRLPKAGGFDDPAIEAIVNVRPDLVLLSTSQRITARLGELGIVSFALSTERYADIAHTVSMIGDILGRPERAKALDASIRNAVSQVSAREKARHGISPSVYFEVDRSPYAAGPGSFIGELLTLLGTRNIASEDLGPFPKLNPEFVVRSNPDVIFVAPADAAQLAHRPGWGEIRAVKEHRVCSFEPHIRDTIVRPGPRVADGMRAIADCLARVAP